MFSSPWRLQSFQDTHRPRTIKDPYTHFVPNVRLPVAGKIVADGEERMAELARAYAADVATSRSLGVPVHLYEVLSERFRFFLEVRCAGAAADAARATARELLRACGAAFRCAGKGENTFYPELVLERLRAVALYSGERLRLVFPELVVDRTRALQLHRAVLDALDRTLDVAHKRRLLGADGPVTDRALSVPHSGRWEHVCPSSVYIEPTGVPMCGSTAVARCDASSGIGKVAHDACAACARTGYVATGGPFVPLGGALVDATAPREEEGEEEASSTEALVRATMLRTTAPLTERYVVPTYAPVVLMEPSRWGKLEPVGHFAAEKAVVAKNGQQRVELDVNSNDFRTVGLVAGVLEACRKMHPNYAQLGVTKLYRYGTAKPVYRLLSDGPNSTFCMRAKRHERCRACFVIEEVGGRGKVCMECFAPECAVNRKRYRSNAVDLPRRLNELLGYASKGDHGQTEDVMLERAATLAFDRLRNRSEPKRRRLGP